MLPKNIAETKLWKTLCDHVTIETDKDGVIRLSVSALFSGTTIISPEEKELFEKDSNAFNYVVNHLATSEYFSILELAGISETDIAEANLCVDLVKRGLV